MKFVNQETKNTLKTISQNMIAYSELVDKPAQKGLAGIGMPMEAKVFRDNAKDVENGVFKVLVMGKFKNGKSTFINALMGKVIMAARATACTAVIATVEYGKNTDEVKVVYSDSSESKTISLSQFTDEFALSGKDQQYIEDGGRFDRFEKVSHVEIQSNDEIFADGLKLIDSPGLEEEIARTKATNEFVPKANAIIFTFSATSLFSANEKEYIAANFAGKNMRNVFFVVNRIDNLIADQLESSVMPAIRNGLANVFTDKNGNFDEELYNKRVFFTNAYGALCIRTGKPYNVILGLKVKPLDIEIEDTGMLKFEESLRDFLNSPERINATFNSTLQNMANTYQIAVKNVANDKAVRQLNKKQREENAVLAKKKLDDAIKEVENIRETVKCHAELIATIVYSDLCNYITNDIPKAFAATANENASGIRFGIGKMMMLAYNMVTKNQNGINDIYQPFSKFTEDFIKKNLEDWSKRTPTLINKEIRDLETELNTQFSNLDNDLENAANFFAYGNTNAPETKGMSTKTALQNAVALITQFDVSLAVENTASGGMGWMDFTKKSVTQLGITVAIAIMTGGTSLLLMAPIEIIQLAFCANKLAQKINNNVGNMALKKLKDRIANEKEIFEKNVINEFVIKGEQVTSTAIKLVNEQQYKMNKLLDENEMSEAEAKAENDRADTALSKMHKCIDDIYNMLYGRIPTETEFLNLAKNEK